MSGKGDTVCGTCGNELSSCLTCECPNDAKCLRLCESENDGRCPHYPYTFSGDDIADEFDEFDNYGDHDEIRTAVRHEGLGDEIVTVDEIKEHLADKDLMARSQELTAGLLKGSMDINKVIACVKDFQRNYVRIKTDSPGAEKDFTPEMWWNIHPGNDKNKKSSGH